VGKTSSEKSKFETPLLIDFFQLMNLNYPLQVFLGLTYHCNLNCKHCYSKDKRNQPDKIDTKRAKTLLKELSSLGIFKVVFTHGENLLRKDFFEILEYCNRLNLYSILISNGIILNDELVIKKIKESKLSKLFISLDSLAQDYHDNLRGKKGSWNSAVNVLNLCSKNNLNFGMITTINNSNFRNLEKLVLFAISKKVKEIDFLTIRPTNQNEKWLADQQIKDYPEIIKQIWFMKKQFKSKILIGFHDPLSIKVLKHLVTEAELEQVVNENECQAGKYFASITPEGDVYPCNFLPLKLGNILNTSFRKIWKKSFKKREKLSLIPEKCQKCEAVFLCRGGCRAFIFHKYKNNFPERDLRCAYF